jgi:2',3'-cyclic-nucleotide 2'-phosphodiesterase (5'-nucleotidase family)
MKRFFLFAAALFLSGCASSPPGISTGKQLSLVMSLNRNLNFEPCGCSLGPIGGIVRESELLAKLRSEVPEDTVFVTGGVTFAPDESKDQITHAQAVVKGETLVKGLNEMKLTALGLSSEDFYLGHDELKKLSNEADFPLVATNLAPKEGKKAFWKASYRMKKDGYTVVILSLSGPPKRGQSEVMWMDPIESARAELAKYPAAKNQTVIVLSSLPDTAVEGLVSAVRGIHVVAGAETPGDNGVIQLGANTLFVNSENRGRVVKRLKFRFQDAIDGLYNSESAQIYGDYLAKHEPKLSQLERRLASSGRTRNRELQRNVNELRKLVFRAQAVPKEISSRHAEYWREEYSLTKEYEPGEGDHPVRDLLKDYKASVHKLAIEEGE